MARSFASHFCWNRSDEPSWTNVPTPPPSQPGPLAVAEEPTTTVVPGGTRCNSEVVRGINALNSDHGLQNGRYGLVGHGGALSNLTQRMQHAVISWPSGFPQANHTLRTSQTEEFAWSSYLSIYRITILTKPYRKPLRDAPVWLIWWPNSPLVSCFARR